jgi:hypothetical protein
MEHIHQYLKVILLSLIVFPVLAEDYSPTEPIARGIIVSSCIDLDSIMQLAVLDKESETEAGMLFNFLSRKGKCGSYNMYIPVFLEKLEFAYTDTNGADIEVWKLHKQEMWSLIQKSYVKRIGLQL